MMKTWRISVLVGLLLALVAGNSMALGLGQIQVRSQHGQPLLAEIPIVSSEPEELRQLQVRIASPETFSRIGLEPPTGFVTNLQFALVLDGEGRPVIRITSVAPVYDPVLNILLEVDWGQGRLVREYSALVDTPQAVAAVSQPPIEAPEPAPAPDVIVREVPSEPEVQSEPSPPPATPGVATVPDEPVPAAPVTPPAPVPADIAAPSPGIAAAEQSVTVRAGDTMSRIAGEIASAHGLSNNQMMLALLQTNPQAFIDGNINLVRAGAVLRMPSRDAADRLSVAEANAEVRSHVARWRERQRPAPQPEAAAVASTDAEPSPSSATTAAQQARLEIAPAAHTDTDQAGTQSGIAAGGEGDMLRQDVLTETTETLAAREAEVAELQSRLDELETINQQQERLLAFKDSELAAAQAALQQSNQGSFAGQNFGLILGAVGGLLLLALLLGLWWSKRKPAVQAYGFSGAAPSRGSAARQARVGVFGAAESSVDSLDPEPVDGERASATLHSSLVPPPAFTDAPDAEVSGVDTAQERSAAVSEEIAASAEASPATAPTWQLGSLFSKKADQKSKNLSEQIKRASPSEAKMALSEAEAPAADTPSALHDEAGEREVFAPVNETSSREDDIFQEDQAFSPEQEPFVREDEAETLSVPDEPQLVGHDTDAPATAAYGSAPDAREMLNLARAYAELGDLETARELLQGIEENPDPIIRDEARRFRAELG